MFEQAWDRWKPKDASLLPGFELWRDGDLAGAEAFFIARHMSDEVARGLGSVFWSQNRFTAARDAFSTAIRLRPYEPMHWHNLGLVQRDLAAFKSALAAFDVALGIDAAYEPSWNERGNVLYDMKRYDDALPHYTRALELNDTRAVVHHNRGMCLLGLGQVAPARSAFADALKRDPDYHWSIDMLERIQRPVTFSERTQASCAFCGLAVSDIW